METVQSQYEYTQALIKHLAQHKKLLIGTAGNHNLWIGKSGLNPYTHFTEQTGAYYTHGATYFTARVGEQTYRISGNHQWRGHSLYSYSHPQKRAYRFDGGAMNSDVVVGGHHHTKEVSQQGINRFGNDSQLVTFMALGSYKAYDEFLKIRGFSKKTPNEMYGSAIVLRADRHQVKPYYDILEACDEFTYYLARKNGMART